MEEIIALQEVKTFPAFHGSQRFNNATCLNYEPEQSTQNPLTILFLEDSF
jgi:quinol monooxygenase YgiN